MQVVSSQHELRAAVGAARRAGRTIGLVPTMGALHAGHLSLVDAARRAGDFVVATIFVNPKQFGAHEDFQRYPRPLEADLSALRAANVDLAFPPETAEIYGPHHVTFVEVGRVGERLEGQFRPGHFCGVATVVLKLFNMSTPDRAYFGQKDYQQTLVVRQMVADLDLPIELVMCPTLREADGLALSSRNVYLSPDERRQATVLYRSLRRGSDLAAAGERHIDVLLEAMHATLGVAADVKLDYLEIVDPEWLERVSQLDRPAIALIAARVGRTRLIDNEFLRPKPNA